jgi:hypothetical protein
MNVSDLAAGDAALGQTKQAHTTFVHDTTDMQVEQMAKPEVYQFKNVVDDTLVKALERPVLIYQHTWDTSGASIVFDPWTLWISNVHTQRRIANHFILSTGGLGVRVVTNGSPYQFGRYALGYWPYYTTDSFATAAAIASKTRVSTLPLYATIDPANDSVIEWTIPEVRQTQMPVISATEKIGSILGMTTSALNSTSTETPYCNITVYAWALDPKVQGSTFTAPFYGTSQEGSISKPLDVIAKGVNMLGKVPAIGPFMTAAGAAIKIGADIARWFGFSRPIDITNRMAAEDFTVPMFANSEGTDITTSLTLTAAPQSVSGVSRFGLGNEDQMAINYLKRKWSYYTSVPWPHTGAVNDTFQAYGVSPMALGNVTTIQADLTTLCYISLPFRFWRGAIEYKIVFCASKFHTGRMMIWYDPDPAAVTPNTETQISKIVDLSDQREIIFVIPYTSYLPMLETNNSGKSWLGNLSTPSFPTMGTLGFTILSTLRPDAADIDIQLYIRGGEDYEVMGPSLSGYYGTGSSNPCGWFPPGSTTTPPTNAGYKYYGTSDEETPDVNLEIISAATERVMSFRSLIKRYCLSDTFLTTTFLSGKSAYFTLRDFPSTPGYTVASNGTFNKTTNAFTPLTYLLPAYLGYRGSIKTKIHAPALTTLPLPAYIIRAEYSDVNNYTHGESYNSSAPGAIFARSDTVAGAIPTSLCNPNQLYGCYSNPWRNPNNFKLKSETLNDYQNGSGVIYAIPNTVAVTLIMDKWTAAGEDFEFVWFMGPPIMYAQSGS